MVLVEGGSRLHPDEPPFCMNVTEISQEEDEFFWSERALQKTGYQLGITDDEYIDLTPVGIESAFLGEIEISKYCRDKKSWKTHAWKARKCRLATGASKSIAEVYRKMNEQIKAGTYPPYEVKHSPKENGLGPKKPATMRSWIEAREYCQGTYPGGELPTKSQWDVACGDFPFCTATGFQLKKTEARFEDKERGPADVDSYPPNANGLKNMTGNVAEWTLEESEFPVDGKIARGGAWDDWLGDGLHGPLDMSEGSRRRLLAHDDNLGFRCVAEPHPLIRILNHLLASALKAGGYAFETE